MNGAHCMASSCHMDAGADVKCAQVGNLSSSH